MYMLITFGSQKKDLGNKLLLLINAAVVFVSFFLAMSIKNFQCKSLRNS